MKHNNCPHCGHTLEEHMMMQESVSSCGIEGAKTDKSICELLEMYNSPPVE